MSPLATRMRRPLSQWNPKRQISWEHYTGVSIEKKNNVKKSPENWKLASEEKEINKSLLFCNRSWLLSSPTALIFRRTWCALWLPSTSSARGQLYKHMDSMQGAELPWESVCLGCLVQFKNSDAQEGAWPSWGLWISSGKCFHWQQHLRQNLELANPQLPDEELSHKLQVRPNVPVAWTVQPLIMTSKQINRKPCQAQRLLSSPVPAALLLLIPIDERRGEKVRWCLQAAATPSSSALNHSAHFSLERLSGARTGTNFSLSWPEQVAKWHCCCVGLGGEGGGGVIFQAFLCLAKTEEPFCCHLSSHLSAHSRWWRCQSLTYRWLHCCGSIPQAWWGLLPLSPYKVKVCEKGGENGW